MDVKWLLLGAHLLLVERFRQSTIGRSLPLKSVNIGLHYTYKSQAYNIYLFAKHRLHGWYQMVMMAQEDDLGLFGQGLKRFKPRF